MGPTWGPSGADRAQVGPMLAPWTLVRFMGPIWGRQGPGGPHELCHLRYLPCRANYGVSIMRILNKIYLVITALHCIQGCQPVRNFRILYGFYMQNTGVRIWPRKYGNWALSVLSLKVLLPEQSLPVLGSKSVRICGILCLRTFKHLFNHQNIQSSLFHM